MSRAYRTKEQWLALFAEFENSQQRQTDFCAERGIDSKYFSARKHQLRNKKQSDFVQVKPQPLSSLGVNSASVVLRMQSTELILPLSVEPRWLAMFRFRLKELIADKAFRENRRITIEEVSQQTGVHRTTLSKIANTVGYSTTTDILDSLCNYFDCEIGDLVEHIKDKN